MGTTVLRGDEQPDLTLRTPLVVSVRRGNQEKTIAQLKSGWAFHTVPTMAYAANSAWQQLVVLAHNLLTNFQIETGAVRRPGSRKRTVLHALQTVTSASCCFIARRSSSARAGGCGCDSGTTWPRGKPSPASVMRWRMSPECLSH